jgi:hypothetical protein
VRRLWPRLPVIVVSAYSEEEFALRYLRLAPRATSRSAMQHKLVD